MPLCSRQFSVSLFVVGNGKARFWGDHCGINVVALLSPIFFVGVLTFIKLADYNFQSMKEIELDQDDDQLPSDGGMEAARPALHRLTREELLAEARQLDRAGVVAKSLAAFLTIAMYGSGYIFSLNFFTGWIVVGIIWIFLSRYIPKGPDTK
jgi:hypothetical protein